MAVKNQQSNICMIINQWFNITSKFELVGQHTKKVGNQ